MLHLVIDWAFNKLISAFSWIKEMTSSFGVGLSKKYNTRNADDISSSPTLPDPRYRKQRQLRQIDFDRGVKNNKLKIEYPFIHSFHKTNGRRSPTFCFPGHANVTLVPFARILSNSTELFPDVSTDAKTYARVLKPLQCAKWQSTDDDRCKKLFSGMRFWKRRKGIFSVLVQIDESDCGAVDGENNVTKMCPMTLMMAVKVREKITELFGEAVALEEKMVFQDGRKAMTIYVAPLIKQDENQRHIVNEAGIEKEEPKQEIEQPLRSCMLDVSNEEEDQYLFLEDKLVRKQDYSRKRKQGKANRKRMRQPASSVPLTKQEISLMGTKSEPISTKSSCIRSTRKWSEVGERKSVYEFPVEKRRKMKLSGSSFDGYLCEEKPSKRVKLIEANFRRLLRKQKFI